MNHDTSSCGDWCCAGSSYHFQSLAFSVAPHTGRDLCCEDSLAGDHWHDSPAVVVRLGRAPEMVTKKAIDAARQQLREKIVALLSSPYFDRPGKLAQAVHPVLTEVLDALDDLDDGQAPLAFIQSRPAHRGINPAEIAELHRKAVSYIGALTRRKVKLPDAIAMIADAFQRGEDAVKKWRLEELNTARGGDATSRRQVDLVVLAGFDKFARQMGHGPTVEQIIEKAKRDGKRLKVLQPNYTKGSKK